MKKILIIILILGGASWYLFTGPKDYEIESVVIEKIGPQPGRPSKESVPDQNFEEVTDVEGTKREENYENEEKEFWESVDKTEDADSGSMNETLEGDKEEMAEEIMNSAENVGMAMEDSMVDEVEESEEMNEMEEPAFKEERDEEGQNFT